MTILINDVFYKIDKIYTNKFGINWLDRIGFDKYFEILEKYELLTDEEQEAFDKGMLLF